MVTLTKGARRSEYTREDRDFDRAVRQVEKGGGADTDYWQEVQERFRSFPLLLSYFGTDPRTAGMVNQKQLREMHTLQCEILGSGREGRLRAMPWVGVLVLAAVGACVGLIGGYILWAPTVIAGVKIAGSGAPWPWWILFLFTAPVFALMGYGGGVVWAGYRRFKALVAPALVLSGQDRKESVWIPRGAMVPLPRLAFVAERGNYYFGAGKQSGVLGGRILLACPEEDAGKDIREMHVRELLALEAGEGNWNGRAGKAGMAFITKVQRAAELDVLASTPKKKGVSAKTGAMVLLVGFAIAAAFNIVASAEGEPLVEPTDFDPRNAKGLIMGDDEN